MHGLHSLVLPASDSLLYKGLVPEDDQIPSAGSAMQFQNFLLNADISSIPDKHVPGASLRGCKY